jgi:hypothetical protein
VAFAKITSVRTLAAKNRKASARVKPCNSRWDRVSKRVCGVGGAPHEVVLGARGCRYTNEITKLSDIRFRALLTEGGAQRLELARV